MYIPQPSQQVTTRARGRIRGLGLLLIGLLGAALGGCVVKEEVKDGEREVRPAVEEAVLEVAPDGSGTLSFTYAYEMGISDEEGIAPVEWEYALITPNRDVLASQQQIMRQPEPDKTLILVTGKRPRRLDVPPRSVRTDGTYVLYVTLFYRDDVISEHFERVELVRPASRATRE